MWLWEAFPRGVGALVRAAEEVAVNAGWCLGRVMHADIIWASN